MKPLNRPAKELARCTKCGRLSQKSTLSPGPDGGLYGPSCLGAAIQAALTSPFPQPYDEAEMEVDDGDAG